jgi:hypothetical protein
VSDRLHVVAVLAMLMLATGSNAFAQAVASGKNEVETDFTFNSSTLTGVDSNRTNDYRWRITYGRLIGDRVAIGPVFTIRNDGYNNSKPMNIGGLARVYVGDLDGRAIPFVELASTRTFNQVFEPNYLDLQVSAGLVFPMGDTGGRFRIAPYYYRSFHDALINGYSYFHSFGVSWSAGLLF